MTKQIMRTKVLAEKILNGDVPGCLVRRYGKHVKGDVPKIARRLLGYGRCGSMAHLIFLLATLAYIVYISGDRGEANVLDIAVITGFMFLSVAGVYLQGEGIISEFRNEFGRVSEVLGVGDIETILSLVQKQGRTQAGVYLTKQWLDILDRRKIVSLPLDMWPYFDPKLEYYKCFCSLLKLGLLSSPALSGSGWEEMRNVALRLERRHRFFPGWFHKKWA